MVDPYVAGTERPEGRRSEAGVRDESVPKPERRAAAKLFDLRAVIGGLFTVYGIVLIITGLLDGKAELAKATGIRINLWTGIGMLVVGLLFLLWMRLTDDGHGRAESPAQADDEIAARERAGAMVGARR